ncbi:MAG: hypothetical protein PHY47_20550 [Lachnospiraceae bacterium]|nr:hypothetical protein [Lachnospiraceae bacterium]
MNCPKCGKEMRLEEMKDGVWFVCDYCLIKKSPYTVYDDDTVNDVEDIPKLKKSKYSVPLLISMLIGIGYLLYSAFYWSGAGDVLSGSESLGVGIAMILVLPHLVCTAAAVLFNIIAFCINNKWLTLTGAILYVVSMMLFPLYATFVIAEVILSFIAFATMGRPITAKSEKRNKYIIIASSIIGALAIIGIVGSMLGDTPASTSVSEGAEAPEAQPSNAIAGGMYKVGVDIPAGEYLLTSNSGAFPSYVEVSSDSSGAFESIVANDNYFNRTYISVADGQYLKFDGSAVPSGEAPAYQSDNGAYPEGQYLVGKDIPAGEYKISLTEGSVSGLGYIEVSSDSSASLDSIVSNANIQGDTYQSVSDGQYLTLSGCEIKAQ